MLVESVECLSIQRVLGALVGLLAVAVRMFPDTSRSIQDISLVQVQVHI